MGIVNRDLDASQKRNYYKAGSGPVATGVTGVIEIVYDACSLDGAQVAAFGLSNALTVQLFVNRFIPGAGFTAFAVGTALTVPAFGTSGLAAAGVSIPAIGSTLTTLKSGDVLMYQTAGTNAAATGFNVMVALRPLNDYVRFFGIL